MRIDGDVAGQQGIRFNIFQLFSTYYGEDARLNIGPKGFTGEKYGGATYWDTEAYCLPMYTAIAGEEVAQNLLKYRWLQIDGAYHNAREQGLPGALYPMVTFTGIECHNEWEITFEEITATTPSPMRFTPIPSTPATAATSISAASMCCWALRASGRGAYTTASARGNT